MTLRARAATPTPTEGDPDALAIRREAAANGDGRTTNVCDLALAGNPMAQRLVQRRAAERPRRDVKVTVGRARFEAYRAAESSHGLPTPSELLDAAMGARLRLAGLEAPPLPTAAPQTEAATRARVQRRRERAGDRGT